MTSRILLNTPLWVWPLLAALVWLGLSQTRARTAHAARVLVLPLAMTAMSFAACLTSFAAAPAVLAAWAAAAGITAWVLARGSAPQGARFDRATGRFQLPGSWWPLALILAVFAMRFVVGATLAMRPLAATDPAFGITAGALYGAFTGLFIGRAGRLWKLRA